MKILLRRVFSTVEKIEAINKAINLSKKTLETMDGLNEHSKFPNLIPYFLDTVTNSKEEN